MRRTYQGVVLIITLLTVAAPVMALVNCGEVHFRCCGIYSATTSISCVTGTYCDGTRAESQEAPDAQALSDVAQHAWTQPPVIGAVPDPPFFAELPRQLQGTETQPRLCTFLI
jgi:hypothetical protein